MGVGTGTSGEYSGNIILGAVGLRWLWEFVARLFKRGKKPGMSDRVYVLHKAA